MWEMHRIPRYEQRLKAIYFIRKINERFLFIEPRIASVSQASGEMTASKGLKRILELALALGNYMNRGMRGGAIGFRLKSLLTIVDTKSSTEKAYTLLNYLVDVVDNEGGHLQNSDAESPFVVAQALDAELEHIAGAAKVSVVELSKEIAIINQGFKLLASELAWHATCSTPIDGDGFVDVVDEFVKEQQPRMQALVTRFGEMRASFLECMRVYAMPDRDKVTPDDFFGGIEEFQKMIRVARKCVHEHTCSIARWSGHDGSSH